MRGGAVSYVYPLTLLSSVCHSPRELATPGGKHLNEGGQTKFVYLCITVILREYVHASAGHWSIPSSIKVVDYLMLPVPSPGTSTPVGQTEPFVEPPPLPLSAAPEGVGVRNTE